MLERVDKDASVHHHLIKVVELLLLRFPADWESQLRSDSFLEASFVLFLRVEEPFFHHCSFFGLCQSLLQNLPCV